MRDKEKIDYRSEVANSLLVDKRYKEINFDYLAVMQIFATS